MRKLYLLLLLIFLLAPFWRLDAITQGQIETQVSILCPQGNDLWSSGSGTIIDSKGIILTNEHVVGSSNVCVIGFISSVNDEPNYYTGNDLNTAEVKYRTITDDMDAAVLYLDNPNNAPYPYTYIWNASISNLSLGDKVEIVGFPSIGGSTLTYSDGTFSGIGSKSYQTQNYFKTTAPIDHGNSGGAAYDASGMYLGIPSMASVGEIASISYVLSIDKIKDWLRGLLGSGYESEVQNYSSPKNYVEPTLESDITPPTISLGGSVYLVNSLDALRCKTYTLETGEGLQDCLNASWEHDAWQGSVVTRSPYKQSDTIQFHIRTLQDNDEVNGYYVYVGLNPSADPARDGRYYTLANAKNKYYYTNTGEEIYYIAQNVKVSDPGINFIAVQARDRSGNLSSSVEHLMYPYWPGSASQPSVEFLPTYDVVDNVIFAEWSSSNDIEGYYVLLSEPGSYALTVDEKVEFIKNPSKEGAYQVSNRAERQACSPGDYNLWVQPKYTNGDLGKPVFHSFYLGDHSNATYHFDSSISCDDSNTTATPPSSQPISSGLIERLVGYILLQVESHGEAWYLDPTSLKRYYMRDGAVAYEALRKFGLGITNSNLDKIPVGTLGDKQPAQEYYSSALVKRLAGRILLQVESHGEAWYVHPVNGKRYYMKDGQAAYDIMRFLSLGITNSDLEKIPQSDL